MEYGLRVPAVLAGVSVGKAVATVDTVVGVGAGVASGVAGMFCPGCDTASPRNSRSWTRL